MWIRKTTTRLPIWQNGFDKETINNCYVTDGSRKLVGVVSLRALVLAKDTAEP